MGGARDHLQSRLDAFHRDRVTATWAGRRALQGRAPGPSSIVLTRNDYLDLSGHPRLLDAMARSIGRETAPLQAAPFLRDDHPQTLLEGAFARHLKAAAGVLCQSGWMANAGLIQVIAGPGVPVYLDQRAHASLRTGVQLAGAPMKIFRHNDPVHLAARLERHGPGVVVVDSVYSSHGSRCPLARFVEVAERYDSLLVVDESHSVGTHGARGEGLVAAEGLEGRVAFRTVSLSKAIPGRAGLVVCDDPEFVDYFKYEAGPAVFSSALLPHDTALLAAALDLVAQEEGRRTRLRELTAWLRPELAELGYDLGGGTEQIIALEVGREADVMLLRDLLERHDVFGAVFVPPATSVTRTLLRLSLHAGLTDAHAEQIIRACAAVRNEAGMAGWLSSRKRESQAT
ncbi:alpha-hydroxyketone-type quorum-sensing autoinducer synthase [Herbidospora daliensis]|uniref:alpha-hydroxyketone-type quorum-sensing autoinducer synthase n=1 Tax=Herbidospora daliensis TaxID=295585 RepID=UPI0007855C1F|nr:alpha-hydroxyketone-type quorum-sensing autoinducer synthase [Herbidospora daliensis]